LNASGRWAGEQQERGETRREMGGKSIDAEGGKCVGVPRKREADSWR
jgi:hypothetical protein